MLEMFIMYILLKWHPSPFYIKDIWWINVALLAILSMFYPHCSIYSNDGHVGQLAGTSNIIFEEDAPRIIHYNFASTWKRLKC